MKLDLANNNNNNFNNQVFRDELEKQKKYANLTDFCDTFEFMRGKCLNEEENETVGEFKVKFG